MQNTCPVCLGQRKDLDGLACVKCDGIGVIMATTIETRDSEAPTVKDSGVRESFPTGSVRDTRSGKGRFDLLPTYAMRRLAIHFENGAKKYGDSNWSKGQPLKRFADSGLRHTFAMLQGETDEDHLAAACWNFLCLMDTQERIKLGLLPKELDDLK